MFPLACNLDADTLQALAQFGKDGLALAAIAVEVPDLVQGATEQLYHKHAEGLLGTHLQAFGHARLGGMGGVKGGLFRDAGAVALGSCFSSFHCCLESVAINAKVFFVGDFTTVGFFIHPLQLLVIAH
ncbi:hypothetical protein D3C85_1011150 [compost metagenome]